MPDPPPITSAAAGDPDKRPAPIPKAVKEVIKLMVFGTGDDSLPMGFIEASKLAGVRPDRMRRWLDRPSVINLLRSERRTWRALICSGNESALRRVRDGENAMASVRAIQVLEQIDAEQVQTKSGIVTQPGISIVIVNEVAPGSAVSDQMRTIDAEPIRQIDALESARPSAEHGPTFIGIDEINGRSEPRDESHFEPIEGDALMHRLADADDRPPPPEPRAETLYELQERLLAAAQPLAPPGMAAAPKQPYDPGYVPPRGRQLPLSRRWRARRGGDEP